MGIFFSLSPNFLSFRYAPFEIQLDGIQSRVSIANIAEIQLTPMKNPVTGEDELATLLKPTGFTAKESELCSAQTNRLTAAGISYDHGGQYGEISPFEYPI